MIQVINELNARGVNAVIIIAGVIKSNFKSKFDHLLENNKNFVKYIGELPSGDIRQFYSSVDIGLNLPEPVNGYVWGYPSKLFDFMNAGIASIQSNLGESKTIIDKEKCGIIVDKFEPDHIVNLLFDLIKNKTKLVEMGKNGRIAFEKEYNWQKVSYRLVNAYKELLEK